MSVVTMRKLLESGVHFGHQTRRWNPTMKDIAEKGGKVLFVGTKKQAQAVVVEEALRSGSFFVNQRWLGGLLTNYRTIQKRVKRLVEIEEMEANGTLDLYPKKEIAQVKKQKARLENFLGGIKEMKKLPNAIFVIDPKEEHNAVAEAKKLGIPVFAIVEAKGGLLSVAHNIDENENDVTMKDVIINVEEQIAENERRRRQRNEERRNRRPYDRNRGRNAKAPYQRRENVRPAADSRPANNDAAKSTEAKPAE